MLKPSETLPESVEISVERMIRFCYLATITHKISHHASTPGLATEITMFGTLVIDTASFLYSLFDDQKGSINLPKIWQGFDHPFEKDLQVIVTQMQPLKHDLQLVRHRLGFHGSLARKAESEGLRLFDIDSGRSVEFISIMSAMAKSAGRMILWFCSKTKNTDGKLNMKTYKAFATELDNFEVNARHTWKT